MANAWARPQLAKRRQIIASLLEKFPETGSRTLARMLHEKHPVMFNSLEKARSSVRAFLGNSGKVLRKRAEKRGTARAPRKPGELPPLPKSEAKPWEPFVLDAKRVLVMGDLHLPYHDLPALECALAFGDKFNPDTILLNGDVFDFFQISRFDKNPTNPGIKEELVCGRQFFDHLRQRFRKAHICFRYGNHDRRWDLFLMRAAPELFDVPGMLDVWHRESGIIDNGITVVREQRPVMCGKLPVFHGDELPKGAASPVNPARGAFLRTLASILQNHLHRTSEHTERTLDDRTITCRSVGALCGLYPDYARINKWDHGFATIEIAKDGNYECELKRIIHGRVF